MPSLDTRITTELEDEFTRTVRLDDGRRVRLSTTDEYCTVIVEGVSESGFLPIGHFEFAQPEYCPGDTYHLESMSLKGQGGAYKRMGIGRAVLQFFHDQTQSKIVCHRPGGPRMNDGSHVIEEGIPFVEKMKKERLLWFPDEEREDVMFGN